AGYGKTAVLDQWAAREDRPCAWLTLDERDDSPIVLCRGLAAALACVVPLGDDLLAAARAPGRSAWTKLVPRLAEAMASLPEPTVVVLDDVSRVTSRASLDVLAALAAEVPAESTLVLSGRTQPDVTIGALRAGGRLFEVDSDLLALSRHEADRLL